MTASGVSLRPWRDEDRPLLHRLLGDEAMTRHIGGPETADQIDARHARYLAEGAGRLFAIDLQDHATPVGWVGYWESSWEGEPVWEAGWHVLPEFQKRGIATAATVHLLDRVADERLHNTVHAFPAVENRGSNAVCRKTGFVPHGETDVEYPKGAWMRANHWCATLPIGRCPECGAPLSAGRSCMENFHELLALEATVAGGAGELPHFYAVASYGLQHPEAMGFTVETVDGLRESVRMALDGRADIAQLRARASRLAAAHGRVTRRGSDPVPAWPVREWGRTVTDVLARGTDGYAGTVREWADAIVQQTNGVHPAS